MPSETSQSGVEQSEQYVANARSLLSDFEDEGVEVKHGVIEHAIEELKNARRSLPDDY